MRPQERSDEVDLTASFFEWEVNRSDGGPRHGSLRTDVDSR